jgi:hypothetical protein
MLAHTSRPRCESRSLDPTSYCVFSPRPMQVPLLEIRSRGSTPLDCHCELLVSWLIHWALVYPLMGAQLPAQVRGRSYHFRLTCQSKYDLKC